ncbi:MAG: hypothetical protein HOL80_03450 [Candidatus Magasanikbacteria bacterium]|nr:hypothetical protein [Candidatus Magasanikbacteria bacterium]
MIPFFCYSFIFTPTERITMSKHFFALFIFLFVATGCDQFCADHAELDFCLVLAELEDRNENQNSQPEVQCELDCAGTYGAVCVDDGDGEGVCECPAGLLEEPLGRCVTPEACSEAIGLTPNEATGECIRDVEDQAVHVSVTPNTPGNLHNGNQDLISFQIYTEEEGVGILSLEFSIFSEGASFFQEEVELFWVIDSSYEEELDSIDLQTIMEDDLSETAGSRYRAQASPEFGMSANTQHEFSLRGGMRGVQSFSMVVSCLTSVRYRSRRTGVEESLALGVEVCNTLRN